MNILITSAGIRGYIIEFFKDSLRNKAKVFTADCNKYAPALYNADDFFILPHLDKSNYIDELLKLCLNNQIKTIVSLNDKELPILAKEKDNFNKRGIKVIISNPEVIEICYDKYKTYNFLRDNQFPFPKTFVCVENVLNEIKQGNLNFPLLIKPRRGSASQGIKKVLTIKEL